MRWSSFQQRLRAFFFRHTAESDLEDELAAHVELQFRKHIAEGMGEEEARRRARIEFGGIVSVREECREVDRWRWIDASARNLKHCFRSLRKSPGFAIVSILILTVGIGSNLAVFTTMDALLFRSLPVERPEELMRIAPIGQGGHLTELPSTGLEVLKKNRALQGMCGFDITLSGVEIDSNMRSIYNTGFTGGCFETLGLHLQLGRPITPADDHLGTEPIAVITDALWRSTFGERADVLGKTLKIRRQMYTIVGVTQRGFTGLMVGSPQEVMIPLLQRPGPKNGTKPAYYWVSVLARRAPGVSEAQAHASVLAQRKQILKQSVPQDYNAVERTEYLSQKLAAISGKTGIDYALRRRFGEPLYALFGICGALLLIACVNLTSLMLARSLSRGREVSVRLALGAKRSHIAGLFVLENAILVLAGTVAGILAGLWTARAIVAQGGSIFRNFRLDVGIDARVVVFLVAVVVLVLAIFGIASVWQACRLSNSDSLKASGRGVIATNTFAQKALVGTQIALTLAFVTASALFGASVKNMYGIDFGIDARNVWELDLAERPNNFDPAAYYRGLLREIESLPNVQSASFGTVNPFSSYDVRDAVGMVENSRIGDEVQARAFDVSDNFLGTLGAKIVAGEDFRRNDSKSGEPTAIVSESLARHFGNPRDLIGHHVRVGSEAEYGRLKVIGVASDADLSLANPHDKKPFTVYMDFWQHLQGSPVVFIKTRDNTLPVASVRGIVRQKGYEYIARVASIGGEIDNALVENRLVAYLSGAFGVLALLMAAVGLFGLLSYQVANRTGEIGIRMALGAKRTQIQWLVLRQIVKLLAFGGLAGLALTLVLGRVIAGLLYGVSAYDAPLLLLSIAVLGATAVVAAWIPVQRASSIDPIEALRHE